MRPFLALAVAILKGFVRDKASVFFAVIFPLMFLVLFGGIFNQDGASRIDLIQVGELQLVEDLPAPARSAWDDTFEMSSLDDLDAAVAEVRRGDADVALHQEGGTVTAYFTQTDQTRAAMTQGALRAFVDGINVAVSGAPPSYTLEVQRVEDDSLAAIDFVTPGLLGWAVAMSAAFGAAATLQGWRQTKMLRRLQLSPVPTRTIVGARIVATLLIAFVQTAIFLGLGRAAFGLGLTGSWWMVVPLVAAGTLCFMALGLLAGAVTKTAEGAVNMANFLVLPMAFLSGSFFPLDMTPTWLQTISLAMPLRHLNDAMLDVMVRGEGPASALLPMLIMLGFATVLTLVAARLFRWETV
ncbi:ABC transporter permease [Nocardioides sp.]|uniref:ABC transporter permease n=1 Tax=Nocardioides sp. TaxID=35761 RepID=UPI002734DF23|nr:ABC transporter permease [Nocardioides sp.]MDP3890895.1 ABC transporter permease [Nocardioides sp.]